MKKTNGVYIAKWYGGALGLMIVLIAAALLVSTFITNIFAVWLVALLGCMLPIVFLPSTIKNKMEKHALALEKDFSQRGFSYQYKFSAHNAIFYIDVSGRLGVVWKHNPTELSFANLSEITDVRVNDGKQFNGGTPRVCCQFKLGKKTYRIVTLLVYNGSYRMNAPEVLEAISKADALCEMLNTAKQAALGGRAAQ